MRLVDYLQIPVSPAFYDNLGAKSARRGNAAKVGEAVRGGEQLDMTVLHEYTHLCNYTHLHLIAFMFVSSIDIHTCIKYIYIYIYVYTLYTYIYIYT